MQITVTEADFERALGETDMRRLRAPEPKVKTLGPEESRKDVLDALPRVIAERFRRMLPADYEIREIELKIGLQGTPFGVGLSGDATLKFGPRENTG